MLLLIETSLTSRPSR